MIMEDINYNGSMWSKWDLHIHSNASDGKQTPEQIVDKAYELGLSVIALTDHHTVANIDRIKEYAFSKGIVVISGIEFRTEYGNKSVHMIGLFPDKYGNTVLNQKALDELVLCPLNLSRTSIIAKGREQDPALDEEKAFKKGIFEVEVDFKKASDLIHKYGGLVSVHAGSKANSIEEMKHEGTGTTNVKDVVDSLGTVKKQLMKKYIDICEIGSLSDKNAQFYIKQYSKPVIVASDAHTIDKIGSLFTWIKADRNFDGLRQIVYEPELRVRIQENEPEKKSTYQVISKIIFNHNDFGNQEIPFNPYLNSIIGGRSSGKSILLGCIAKLADYKGKIKKDNNEYDEYISEISKDMIIIWADGFDKTGRKVEYFPQSYINALAAKTEKTTELIESILKGDEKRRLYYEEYERGLTKNNMEIHTNLEQFFNLSNSLVEYEEQIKSIGDMDGIKTEIQRIQCAIEEAKKNITYSLTEEDDNKYKTLKNELKSKQAEKESLKNSLVIFDGLAELQIMKDIASNIINLPNEIGERIALAYDSLKQETETKWIELIEMIKEEVLKKISEIEVRSDEISKDDAYISGEMFYKENAVIEELSKRLDNEKRKASDIKEKTNKYSEIKQKIYRIKTLLLEKQAEYYKILDSVAKKVAMERDEVTIVAEPHFAQDRLNTFIEDNFTKRSQKVQKLIDYTWKDAQSFSDKVEEIFNGIINNEFVFKQSKDARQAITQLLSECYYRLSYDVKYQGDNLSSMSEGKKAFVILRLILDFDENECPILIDQPEDDLDNRAIYHELVDYIRMKKISRQIILVTHNPNVVVGADSEEIIVANQNGVHNENQDNLKFEYRTGSLENSEEKIDARPVLLSQGMRQHVCDLLEGGDDAFKKREMKYGFAKNM